MPEKEIIASTDEINGSIYSDKELYRVDTYFPKALAIELNTLTGLVDYIKSSIDEMPGKMIVDVKDPETVRLYSQLDPKKGCWITLSEWKYSKEKGRFVPVCVKTEYVDGEKIKEDTMYSLKDGEFVEVCEHNE